MRTLNLGILAHVDAGKTSLTERLLYATHVIDAIGSVDDGTTQTDTLDLERRRGITIKAAVVSFVAHDVTINLIDTPGHPDFIAEVERVLNVLDGAVLVISAVEGVQAQTRVLLRTLERLRIPTLLFVNKIDRRGANADRVLKAIAEKLTPSVVAMGSVRMLGTRDSAFRPYDSTHSAFVAHLAEVLADHDDAVLAAYVENANRVPYATLRNLLAVQTGRGRVHPVFFGSAMTGAGVDPLIAAITELLPAASGDVEAPLSGTVFKVDRGPHRREDRLRATVYRLGARPPARARTRRRANRHRDPGVRCGRRRAAAVGQCGPHRETVGTGRRADRRYHRCAAIVRGTASLLAADAGNGHRTAPPTRKRRAAGGARSAGGTGPADQSAAGRHPQRTLRFAVRRSAEGSHPRHAGRRLRHRRRVSRNDDDLHRAANRFRRRGRSDARSTESVSRDDRAYASILRRSVPACASNWRSNSARSASRFTKRSKTPWQRRCSRVCTVGA